MFFPLSEGARSPTLAAWNPSDKGAAITLSDSDLTATCNTTTSYPSAAAVRSTIFVSKVARFYWEIQVVNTGTYFTVGCASQNANLANYLGSQAEGWGFRQNGEFWHDGAFSSQSGFTQGDYVGVALDKIAGRLWFSVNGVWITGDPAAGTGAAFDDVLLQGASVRPVISINNLGDAVTANFGQSAFQYSVPDGFRPGFGLGV